MSEGELQKATLDLARLLGWRVARFPGANFVRTLSGREFVKPLAYDTKGFPDALLVRDRLIAVEFKADRGVASLEQALWMTWLNNADVELHVWYPHAWTDGTIARVLKQRVERAAA